MNRRLAALMIPLALAGCATHSRVSADEGLRARLARSPQGLVVALSEPAHVAVFEVTPGKRVELRYPAVESDPLLLPAGRTLLEPGGRRIYTYRAPASGRRAPLLYMIASRHPLDDALIREMQQAWSVLDDERFRSADRRETMEGLASLVVPAGQPETDWATDALLTRRPGSVRNAGSAGARAGGEGGLSVYCGPGRPLPTSSSERICP